MRPFQGRKHFCVPNSSGFSQRYFIYPLRGRDYRLREALYTLREALYALRDAFLLLRIKLLLRRLRFPPLIHFTATVGTCPPAP